MNGEILEFLKVNDVEYEENLSLRKISAVKIGSEAYLVAYPDSISKFILLTDFLENRKTKYKILGRMSNVLPPDEYYDGVIVRSDRACHYNIKGREIIAESGISLPKLASVAMRHSLSGLESLGGIPGSLGGAIYQNAGAFGRTISDVIVGVTAYDVERRSIFELTKSDCSFGYRESVFNSRKYVILNAKISLTQGRADEIKALAESYYQRRRETQPINMPSLGSVFKITGSGISAAQLIDECGLKGLRVGGASVSQKHAGFIVNDGLATSRDYLSLIEIVREKVKDRFGIELECEIEML